MLVQLRLVLTRSASCGLLRTLLLVRRTSLFLRGSGANVTIPAGQTKSVYSDGAGSGAAIVDAFATLNVVDLLVDDDLTVAGDVAVTGDYSSTTSGTSNLRLGVNAGNSNYFWRQLQRGCGR